MEVDEKNDQDLLKKLQEIGLNEKESRVYMALLPRQDTGTSKLIQATGLHGQFVYDALAKLEEVGLAKHVVQNGRKKFSANTPNRLLSLVDEKRLAAQSIVRELQNRYVGRHEQNFEVFQGESAFSAHQYDLMQKAPEGSSVDVIAGPTERFLSTLGPEGDEYERIRIARGITVRYIGAPEQRPYLSVMQNWRKLWTFRILPGHSTGLVNTDIWAENVTLNVFGDPVLSLTLTSKAVADGYREFFETLWNLSENEKPLTER